MVDITLVNGVIIVYKQTSVLGIGVRKRKYADTPLHRSVSLRQYADRCVYADTPIAVCTNVCSTFTVPYSEP